MKLKNTKSKIIFIVMVLAVFGLSALAVYLAQSLQLRRGVSPGAPESVPAAAVPIECRVGFTVSALGCYEGSCSKDSQCASGLVCDSELGLCVNSECSESEDCICDTGVGGGGEETLIEDSEEEIAENTYSCDSACSTDAECQSANSSYICYSATNTCRHKDYPAQTNCYPAGSTNSPNPTLPPNVPESGISLPTVAGIGAGIFLILGALILAL